MANYGSGGIAGGWEFAAEADREEQAARLRNALVATQLQQAQRAEAQQNALREQLQRATEGSELDLNALSRALIAGGDTAGGVNLLKAQQTERAQQAEQNAMRQMFHVEPQAAPQATPRQPDLSFLSPRDAAALQADMARNPAAPAQFSNAPGMARTPPQWGQGMPLNLPTMPQPQAQPSGILGPYLSHSNPDVKAMAQQVQQMAAAGLFRDRTALSAAVEKVANAAVQAGNIDRSMAGGALTPAVNAAGQPVFVQAGRGGAGVQQVPGFAPPPGATSADGGWREQVARERLEQQQRESEARLTERRERQIEQSTAQFSNRLDQAKVPTTMASVRLANETLNKFTPADIPGVGGIKNLQTPVVNFFLGEEGKNVKSTLQGVANDLLNMYSGLAVTVPETDRRDLEMMRSGAFTAQDMYNAWPRVVARMNATLGNVVAGYGPDVVNTYQARPGAIQLEPVLPATGTKTSDKAPAANKSQAPTTGWKVIR